MRKCDLDTDLKIGYPNIHSFIIIVPVELGHFMATFYGQFEGGYTSFSKTLWGVYPMKYLQHIPMFKCINDGFPIFKDFVGCVSHEISLTPPLFCINDGLRTGFPTHCRSYPVTTSILSWCVDIPIAMKGWVSKTIHLTYRNPRFMLDFPFKPRFTVDFPSYKPTFHRKCSTNSCKHAPCWEQVAALRLRLPDFHSTLFGACARARAAQQIWDRPKLRGLGKHTPNDSLVLVINLVGGLNPSEKYESQLGWLFPIYGKIKNGKQTTNQ